MEKSDNHLITAIIPCFNAGPFIGETITSVLAGRGGSPPCREMRKKGISYIVKAKIPMLHWAQTTTYKALTILLSKLNG